LKVKLSALLVEAEKRERKKQILEQQLLELQSQTKKQQIISEERSSEHKKTVIKLQRKLAFFLLEIIQFLH